MQELLPRNKHGLLKKEPLQLRLKRMRNWPWSPKRPSRVAEQVSWLMSLVQSLPQNLHRSPIPSLSWRKKRTRWMCWSWTSQSQRCLPHPQQRKRQPLQHKLKLRDSLLRRLKKSDWLQKRPKLIESLLKKLQRRLRRSDWLQKRLKLIESLLRRPRKIDWLRKRPRPSLPPL